MVDVYIQHIFTFLSAVSCITFPCNVFLHKHHLKISFISNHNVFALAPSHHLRSLLDGGFLLDLLGRRHFTRRAGEQDQVVFGLRDLWRMNKSELKKPSTECDSVELVFI